MMHTPSTQGRRSLDAFINPEGGNTNNIERITLDKLELTAVALAAVSRLADRSAARVKSAQRARKTRCSHSPSNSRRRTSTAETLLYSRLTSDVLPVRLIPLLLLVLLTPETRVLLEYFLIFILLHHPAVFVYNPGVCSTPGRPFLPLALHFAPPSLLLLVLPACRPFFLLISSILVASSCLCPWR